MRIQSLYAYRITRGPFALRAHALNYADASTGCRSGRAELAQHVDRAPNRRSRRAYRHKYRPQHAADGPRQLQPVPRVDHELCAALYSGAARARFSASRFSA
jgi:hypothetical protein